MSIEARNQALTEPPVNGGSKAQSTEKNANNNPKKPRSKRPNYNQIHAKPLPLEVHPLPAFIPHNPLSIVRIAIALFSQYSRPRKSHSIVHKAYFSLETQAIHVTDPASIRALWEQGFWGSGSLSRSEPRWLDQEKRRLGLEAAVTSEEFTRGRREERRQFKLERAKAQREAIEQQQREEGKLDADTHLEDLVETGALSESPKGTLYPADGGAPLGEGIIAPTDSIADRVSDILAEETSPGVIAIADQEHLQLTFEEAFFLSYVLGVLEIYHDNTLLHPVYLLRLFSAYSEFPLRRSSVHPIAPDDAFMLKYVVFHHFRSLGWVIRPGIKFACDYLLYLRGPAFHHAEFAIMVIPSYSHPYWSETADRRAAREQKEKKDWWWLHRLNRVQTQVHKSLMLVYVEVPPPWDEDCRDKELLEVDIGSVLLRYKVREFIWRRWSPNRNRD